MGAGAGAGKPYNFAVELVEPNLGARAGKTAFVDANGAYSYADTAERVNRAGAALLRLGLTPGDRVMLCILDGIDFVASFLGAVKAGLVPIAVNTLLTAEDYAYMLTDSGARAAIVSDALAARMFEAAGMIGWAGHLIVSGAAAQGQTQLSALMGEATPQLQAHPTRSEDVAFWLYSSGSTGRPKGAPHRQSSPILTADLFARDTFGLREDDIVYSAAKLFFAYGLGNALTFPMRVGATAILVPGRVTPAIVEEVLGRHNVTIFCGAPTLFGGLLAANKAPAPGSRLRLCMSAGEALPEEVGRNWAARSGVDIIDGIGSTEMLHIFVSNRPGAVRYGTAGRPVAGYDVKLVDEAGGVLGPGDVGELYVRGPTMTTHYWNQPEKTAATFIDGWMKTGDKFLANDDGTFQHLGRTDDMLKVSGVWVSPIEVEGALLAHDAVLEAAVIGVTDEAGLVKTKAFIVLREGVPPSDALAQALKDHTKSRLAPFKYPRSIEFVPQLPRTATGKIRRFVLRDGERGASSTGENADEAAVRPVRGNGDFPQF